jgi:hypothetical protein
VPSAPDDRLGTQLAHIVAEIRIYQGFEEVLLIREVGNENPLTIGGPVHAQVGVK